MPRNGWLEGQTLQLAEEELTAEDEVAAREAQWWFLNPGEPGYDQPLYAYCGFTEQEWRERQMSRGWR